MGENTAKRPRPETEKEDVESGPIEMYQLEEIFEARPHELNNKLLRAVEAIRENVTQNSKVYFANHSER